MLAEKAETIRPNKEKLMQHPGFMHVWSQNVA